MSEKTTTGLVASKLSSLSKYPASQNTTSNDITFFVGDSYQDNKEYSWLCDRFAKASKKQTYKDKGEPDLCVVKHGANVIVVIECKEKVTEHSSKQNVEDYLVYGYGGSNDTQKYAIDGALWYAEFLKDEYDVICVAVSGTSKTNSRVSTFVYPRKGLISDIRLLEDGSLNDSLVSINQYEQDIISALERNALTEEEIRKNLRSYTLACANYLRQNGIEDNSKAGFVSAIILGLTNTESALYSSVKTSYENISESSTSKLISEDQVGLRAVALLREALYGNEKPIYDDQHTRGIFEIDGIPAGKRYSLKQFYDVLLMNEELTKSPRGTKNKYFRNGDTVLSRCIYSLYENVILVLEKYRGIDVMGEFYTTFLRFTKGNAKEKGIVLTPKHITELFCDLAEYYGGKKLDETTTILDPCCGTGGFLISALERINKNIYSEQISGDKKKTRYTAAQNNSLIGVEKDPSMYALAYANMRFHKDGKSNLFNCSSLMSDSYLATDGRGDTFVGDKRVPLSQALSAFSIDIGMINPPYALGKNDEIVGEYEIVISITRCEEAIKKTKQQLKDSKSSKKQEELKELIEQYKQELKELKEQLENEKLGEIVIQSGQSELDFIASMLHYLKEGGIGIAIVPMSCAGNSKKKLRARILKYHSLLACMTMPSNLFKDSNVGTNTCIMVFKAHIPHDENKSVFFGRWLDDGFEVIPHNGRKDTGRWEEIHSEWLDQIDGSAVQNDKVWLNRKIKTTSEALAEAYIKTDYRALNEEDFTRTLKKYAFFQYMEQHGLLELSDAEKLDWLLGNSQQFENQYSKPKVKKVLSLSDSMWSEFCLNDLFEITPGKRYDSSDYSNGDTPYISSKAADNGIKEYISLDPDFDKNCITTGKIHCDAFYQGEDFCATNDANILKPRDDRMNKYVLIFIVSIINFSEYTKWNYGRQCRKGDSEKIIIELPSTNGDLNYRFMEDYIKSLPFSCKI